MSQGTSASPDASSAVGEAEGAPACPGSCHLPGSHGPRGLAGLGYLEWHSRIDRKVSPQSWHAQVALSTAPGLWALSRAREGGQPASVCTSLCIPGAQRGSCPSLGAQPGGWEQQGSQRAPITHLFSQRCWSLYYIYVFIYFNIYLYYTSIVIQ